MSKTCSNCQFWDQPSITCRRFPPQVVSGERYGQGRAMESQWPETGATQTCGEHVLKPKSWAAPSRTSPP